LDTDANKSIQVDIKAFRSIEELQAKVMKDFGLEGQDERLYGLKDSTQGFLLQKLEDIAYLNCESLIFRNLSTEAKEAIAELDSVSQDHAQTKEGIRNIRAKLSKI